MNLTSARSLQVRLALTTALVVSTALIALSLLNTWRERQLLEHKFGQMIASLDLALNDRLQQSMLARDPAQMAQAIDEIGRLPFVDRARLVNLAGQVVADNVATGLGETFDPKTPGCWECHQASPATRPQTVFLTVGDMLRVASPIANQPACQTCHDATQTHLGVLLIDAPLRMVDRHLAWDLGLSLVSSVGVALFIALFVYFQLQWAVVRRLAALRAGLAQFGTGQLTVRLPTRPAGDELDTVADSFNQMAAELEAYNRQAAQRQQLRFNAIVEERERIARELHDGLGQLLGYVNTKAIAIQLLLEQGQVATARTYLTQLAEAAQHLSLDVREAILGLRLANAAAAGLVTNLREYVAHFGRLSGLPVALTIAPTVEPLALDNETAVQMLRVVQEALSNVRKHAAAQRLTVTLQRVAATLEICVIDDGRGFDLTQRAEEGPHHFGLHIMQERAATIGGQLTVTTAPGAGTRVTLTVPLALPAERA